ncbi:hypothetical protein Drorol1_Dr00014346 [Drosera rotundifolia]
MRLALDLVHHEANLDRLLPNLRRRHFPHFLILIPLYGFFSSVSTADDSGGRSVAHHQGESPRSSLERFHTVILTTTTIAERRRGHAHHLDPATAAQLHRLSFSALRRRVESYPSSSSTMPETTSDLVHCFLAGDTVAEVPAARWRRRTANRRISSSSTTAPPCGRGNAAGEAEAFFGPDSTLGL